jgi:Family of unknown function (DUF6174)
MNTRLAVILLILALSGAALGDDKATEQHEFRLNRAKWERHGIASYEFRLRDENCYCLHALGYGPFRVTIKQGKVVKAIYEGEKRDGYWPGRIVPKKIYEKTDLIATVEEVFARTEMVINSPDQPHKITYDPEYGFPTLIDVDEFPHITDTQWRLIVDDFRSANDARNPTMRRTRESLRSRYLLSR